MDNIVLIGMPGTGKSTVGQALAARLDYGFVDVDDLIVEAAGKTLPDILRQDGLETFYKIENQVGRELEWTHTVIATGGSMVLYCRKNRLGHNRLGLTASVKLGGAVVRNRCRRRLREVYRLQSGRLRQGWDIILVARKRTAQAPWRELNDTFVRLCRNLDLWEDKL